MKPYYEHAGITIYHGDSIQLASELDYDVVITDPPYGVGLSEDRPKNMQQHSGSYDMFDDTEGYVREKCVPIIKTCIERAIRVAFTPGQRCMYFYPVPTAVMAFYTPSGAGRGRWRTFSCWQPILCYGPGPKRTGCYPNVYAETLTPWDNPPNGHPCPKPEKMWRWLLGMVSTDDSETIMDPFMGSGTTLRVAKDTGRRAIGIDISEKYCEIAAKRMQQEVLPW